MKQFFKVEFDLLETIEQKEDAYFDTWEEAERFCIFLKTENPLLNIEISWWILDKKKAKKYTCKYKTKYN